MKQTCRLPIPPSTNHLYKNLPPKPGSRQRSRALTEEGNAFKFEATLRIKMAMKPVKNYPVAVRIRVFGSGGFSSSRDIANCEKIVTDCVVAAGIIADDKVKYVWENCQIWRPLQDPKSPALCFVEVEELTEEVIEAAMMDEGPKVRLAS